MSLIISKNKVSLDQIIACETPAATETFVPVPHIHLINLVKAALTLAGLTIVEEEHALARHGLRYFGGFAVTGKGIGNEDRQAVVGLRNSNDKAFAAAICMGSKMMVCENLDFASDEKLSRRHTVNVMADLPRVIAGAIGRVVSHWNDMENRIEAYKATKITEEQAQNILVSLVDSKAIPARNFYPTLVEFRAPRHAEFEGMHLFNLYNAVTEHLKGSDLFKLAFRTMTTQSIFDPIASHVPHLEVQEIVTQGCEENQEPDGTQLSE